MILDIIVEKKVEEVALLKSQGAQLPKGYEEAVIAPPRGFRQALVDYPGVAVIAEAKKASPSKGVISPDFDPVAIAKNYEAQGAQAVSVLTDVDFFQGSLLYLLQVREAISLPVIRKDFIIDELQIHEAKLHGADAILLIVAILDLVQLKEYQACARELGMDILVEVHDEKELELALAAESDLIGVNNRNLNTFDVDIETTFRLQKLIPPHIPLVSESGLQNSADMARLKEHGVAAALIGESLMRAGKESGMLGQLRA